MVSRTSNSGPLKSPSTPKIIVLERGASHRKNLSSVNGGDNRRVSGDNRRISGDIFTFDQMTNYYNPNFVVSEEINENGETTGVDSDGKNFIFLLIL